MAEVEAMRTKGVSLLERLVPNPLAKEDGTDYGNAKKCFNEHGFALLPSFVDPEGVASMKNGMAKVVECNWNPGETKVNAFTTDEKQVETQGKDDYFMLSSDKVRFFAETGSLDESGKLIDEFKADKLGALNKVGHGLHLPGGVVTEGLEGLEHNPFHSYADSEKLRHMVKCVTGFTDAVLPQSMYIFKQAKIGGEVTSHQDSTFLYTTPRQTCVGLWLALDDATLENGCLWVRPGSQKEPLRRKFVRNPEYFEGKPGAPCLIFEQETDLEEYKDFVPWEGKLPDLSWPPPCEGLFKAGFVPVECKAGDLLVFPGTVDHLSLPNYSKKARHTFQLHLVEGPGAGVTWSPQNWLQYPDNKSFMSIAYKGQ